MHLSSLRTCLAGLLCLSTIPALPSEIAIGDFNGRISREALEYYLSRAVTHMGLCSTHGDPTTRCLDDDIRMLTDIGARFVGRAAFAWTLPDDEEAHFQKAKDAATKVHRAAPDMILQACVFETVSTKVERIPIPAWVFEAFDLPPEQRNFNYEAMLYENGQGRNQWTSSSSVPDMSRLETRLWFYYRARRYIDCGMEAIHFGQVMIMDDNDPGHKHWIDMLTLVRQYAKKHARRHLVLCDAHTHGTVEDGKLLFDFHSFPLRIAEVKDSPQEGMLDPNHVDNIFGRSKGGITPSGWTCENLPYLAEYDNWGYTGKGGQSIGGVWVWGYDEISWFAHQRESYRNEFIRYAWDWVRQRDPNGYVQMPTRRILAGRVNELSIYCANKRSYACPNGFSVEDAIKDVWSR